MRRLNKQEVLDDLRTQVLEIAYYEALDESVLTEEQLESVKDIDRPLLWAKAGRYTTSRALIDHSVVRPRGLKEDDDHIVVFDMNNKAWVQLPIDRVHSVMGVATY